MRKILAAIALIVVLVGAYVAYQRYEASQLVVSIAPHVKSTSIRLQGVIETRTSPGNISWAEAFRKAEDAIKATDDALIALQTLDASANVDAMSAAIEYMKASQSLARALNSANRSMFELSNATNAFGEAIQELQEASGYSREFATKTANRASVRAEKAASEAESSIDSAREAMSRYLTRRTEASAYFKDAVVPQKTVDDLEKDFAEIKKKN